MRNSMTKFFLVVALAGFTAGACSSSSNPAGAGGAGGHAAGGTTGAGGTSATGGTGGSGGTTGSGGAAGGTTGAGGAAGAGVVNTNLLNAPTTSVGIPPTRTVPANLTAQNCPT
jgi:hypothetical protein